MAGGLGGHCKMWPRGQAAGHTPSAASCPREAETPPPRQAPLGRPASTSASPPSSGPLNTPIDDVSASTGAVSYTETGPQRVSAAWS